ncbi:MAG: hypothetical protein ACF8R7_14005 [Phycisphaerales bacterium JB039]
MHLRWLAPLLIVALGAAASAEPVRISHSRIQSTLQPGTIAAIDTPAPQTTRDNRWYRIFELKDFVTESITVSAVRIGVEIAEADPGSQPVTVRLYAGDLFGEKELRAEAEHMINNKELALEMIPIRARFQAHETMIVEIEPLDHGLWGLTGQRFFIGTNRWGETGPSYLASTLAGDPVPAPYSAIGAGYPDMAIVMTVFARTGCDVDCDGDGVIDILDFVCFQSAFGAGDPVADCDRSGALDLYDFLCFTHLFALGCP